MATEGGREYESNIIMIKLQSTTRMLRTTVQLAPGWQPIAACGVELAKSTAPCLQVWPFVDDSLAPPACYGRVPGLSTPGALGAQ